MALPEGLPELTLGWDVLTWGSLMLAQPDGEHMGDPWVYSDEQAEFILWFYAIDEDGTFIYRKAVLERPKGWGKSPLLAAICCSEFMGPVDFAGFDSSGKPVGKMAPSPLVQIAAISDSQAENTYALVRQMLMNGAISEYYPEMEVMLSKTIHPGGRILEKVTASPRGREGNRATFVVMDETHLWVPAEKGPELYEALTRNLVKMDRRFIQTTNAPVPGEGSVAETIHIAYQQQLDDGNDPGLLFDSREVNIPNIYDKEVAFPALEHVYGDAAKSRGGWVNLERIWAEITDPATREPVARRFYFNQRVSPPSSWLQHEQWMACFNPKIKLSNMDDIALGFKSAINNGAACLIAVRLQDGALFKLGWWEPPAEITIREQTLRNDQKRHDDVLWKVDWDDVNGRVRNVLKYYNVHKMLVDPVSRRDVSSKWYATYPKSPSRTPLIEEYWLRGKGKTSLLVEQFEQMVESERLSWASEDISRHVLNCHTTEVPDGKIIRKETPHSRRYIGGAQAALLAVEAASLAIQEGGLNGTPGVFSF